MTPDRPPLSLGSTSDLVVVAPWRPGLIQAEQPILPQTRLALTFRTLFELRRRGREEVVSPVFPDLLEKLGLIHSFRFSAQPEGLLLAVTYDFEFDGYVRALRRDAGPFLDLLCCHCADYPLARSGTPLDDWRQWILKNQRGSDYFYTASPLAVGDFDALRQGERLQREDPDPAASDRRLAGLASRTGAIIADGNRRDHPEEGGREAIAVIAAMYALTPFWTADAANSTEKDDAITLLRATQAIVERSFIEPGSLPSEIESAYATELSWYRQKIVEPDVTPDATPVDYAYVQRGILKPYDADDGATITHGAAVFLAIGDEKAARKSLAGLALTGEAAKQPVDEVFRNLAFTFGGLRRLDLAAGVLDEAPTAFREGAAARSGRVGDVRGFNAANWRPLTRNWGKQPDREVDRDLVDVFVQLRVAAPGKPVDPAHPKHPLAREIKKLAALKGLDLLAVEWLNPADPDHPDINHLGLRDGISQPTLTGLRTTPWSDVVPPATLLVGRDGGPRRDFWRDGSFLAVRRMPIDRPRYDSLLARDTRPAMGDRALLAAKIVGRTPDGAPLATAYGPNNFIYEDDPAGELCPLTAHARRANPRTADVPRIMRRGMSFGPRLGAEGGGERGTMFMAYCANLAEQYERVLGWINGGNSTRAGSYQADPLIGVPEPAPRTFRFLGAGDVRRLTLPDAGHAIVGLSWSFYFFAPSLPAIRALAERPEPSRPSENTELAEGKKILKALQGADAERWHEALNEPAAKNTGVTKALWAAIRDAGGIVETPVGYLVASYHLVMTVLRDDGQRFSNTGAGARMKATIGPFHLGMDPYTADYQFQSRPANAALTAISQRDAFELARGQTAAVIQKLFKQRPGPRVTVDLIRNLIEPVLGAVAVFWFDLPDGHHIRCGSSGWKAPDDGDPCFPGDFWSPSLYTFEPFPPAETTRLAPPRGKAIVEAAEAYITSVGRGGLRGKISAALAKEATVYRTDADLARVLVGVMIGAVPTIALNAFKLLTVGIASSSLSRAQPGWLDIPVGQRDYGRAAGVFREAINWNLQTEPVPELLWRTVAADGATLGGKTLEKDKPVIFSLESAALDSDCVDGAEPWIAFGMAPPAQKPPTPHGCPGRDIALGVMLGLIVGLVENARIRSAGATMAELEPLR